MLVLPRITAPAFFKRPTRRASSLIEANARSASFIGGSRKCRPESRGTLENPFLAAQIAERSDVREDQRHAELVFRAHLAERDAAVFERDAAAAAVVADLHKLVLQGVVGQIVADAAGGA